MATLNEILSVEAWEQLTPTEKLRVLDELRSEVIYERDKAAITIVKGTLEAETPLGRIKFPLHTGDVTLRPGDTLQLKWTYDGFVGA